MTYNQLTELDVFSHKSLSKEKSTVDIGSLGTLRRKASLLLPYLSDKVEFKPLRTFVLATRGKVGYVGSFNQQNAIIAPVSKGGSMFFLDDLTVEADSAQIVAPLLEELFSYDRTSVAMPQGARKLGNCYLIIQNSDLDEKFNRTIGRFLREHGSGVNREYQEKGFVVPHYSGK